MKKFRLLKCPRARFVFQPGSRERDFLERIPVFSDALVCAPGNGAPCRYAAARDLRWGGRAAAALPHFRPRKPKLRPEEKDDLWN